MRRSLRGLALLAVLTLAPVLFSNAWVTRAASGRLYSDLAHVPAWPVALVLGTSPTTAGRPNLYYEARLGAAAALYKMGKVQNFILSGDNFTASYDEPGQMKRDLSARGVPAERLYPDDAGFRTLDSVVRARKVFGQSSVLIVSQRFHNERAVFLARQRGLDAVGFNAADVTGAAGLKTRVREWLARASAVLDVTVPNQQPKFLGAAVVID